MAIHITCPSCDAAYSVDDDKRGKKIRCRKCAEPISVPAGKPTRRDEEAVQSGAKVKIKPTARSKDDDERRPTPRRKEPAKGGFPVMLLALGGAAVLLFLICGVGGIGGFFYMRGRTPAPVNDDAQARAEGHKHKDALPDDKGNAGEQQKQPFDDKLPAEIPPEFVPRVKEATVYLKVTMPNNSVATGSGFFALEPGIVVTNAHVLGMLKPKSQPPKNIEVVVNAGQGQDKERRMIGEVLGVDRINDLGVVRLNAPNLPAPLFLESKHETIETQKVYIFGFPFGEDVAKTITVANSSISGFQHDQQTRELTQIRVNGGMHPGNSGGPVVNARGQVIGVSVAGIKGTFINFAVPAAKVRAITEGGFMEAKYGEPFLDRGARHLPVHFSCLDPMNRIKEMRVEVWVGGAGPARLPSAVKPEPEPGDSARTSHAITYRDGIGKLDVPLPPLAPGQVYWLQPVLVTPKGTRWGPAQATMQTLAFLERKPADLTINFTAQKQRFSTLSSVYTVTEAFGKLKFVDSQQVNAEFYEVLFPDEYRGKPAARVKTAFGALSLGIFRDGKRVTHPELPRGLGIVRTMPPTCVIQDTNEIGNFITVSLAPTHPLREMVSDLNHMVQNPLEAATIKMPNQIVQPMQTFPAKSMMLFRETQKGGKVRSIFVDLMLTCTYQGTRVRDGREEALITFVGNLEGRNEFKGKIDGQLSGKIGFDVAGRFLSLVQLKILSEADFGDASFVREQDILVNRVAGNPKNLALLEEKKGPGPGPGPDPGAAKGRIVLSRNSTLTNTDPIDPTAKGVQARMKTFPVTLQAGVTYVISMNSNAFDSYLRLEYPIGRTVAEDDDSGGNLNARIVYRPSVSGLHRIVATSFKANATGPFQLIVQELDAPKGGPIGPPPKQDLGKILGGAFDPQFKDEAPDGSFLVGLEVGLGKFANNDVVKAIRPIYRDAKGKETLGKQYGKDLSRVVTVKAKPGYAIGGLTVNAGLGIDGFTATYLRVNGAQLDAKDAYQSEYVGGKGGSPSTLGGDGTAVIGIIGKSNANDCTGIGLLYRAAPEKKGDPPPPIGAGFKQPAKSKQPTSYLKIFGAQGDYITQGKSYDYAGNDLIVKKGPRGVNVRVDGWSLDIGAPNGEFLKVGEFLNAKRFAFSGDSPGLDFNGKGRGSNRIAGEFVVWEIEVQDNQIVRLAIDFVQRSEEKGPPVQGKLRINSNFE